MKGLAAIGKDIYNSPELATFFTFFLRKKGLLSLVFCSVSSTKAFQKLFLFFQPPPLK